MKKVISFVLSAAMHLAFLSMAHAHAIWVEKTSDGKPSVCYGEYGEGLREGSGGKLDQIAHLEAWSTDATGARVPLAAVKGEDRFSLESASSGVAAQELGMPVKDMTKYKIGVAKTYLYARYGTWDAGQAKPEMRLDAVPSGTDKVTVYFDGQPLAGEKTAWTAPNGWMKEIKTGEDGALSLEKPWPGLYVLEVTRTLEKPGEFEGQPYQVERHRLSYSVEKV